LEELEFLLFIINNMALRCWKGR